MRTPLRPLRLLKNNVAPAILVGSLLVACSSPEQISTAPRLRPVPPTATLLMTGEPHEAASGAWRVRVSSEEVQVSSLEPGGSIATSSKWTPGHGWFAFIENDQRVWLYDGDRRLRLVEMQRDGNHTKLARSGPTKFSSPVPPQVLARLSERARNAIATQTD